jgi:phosphoribosyl 1,2-cyclic phosphodiesterase
MRFSILASGSTGNAAIVQSGGTTIMIDAGLSAKKLEQLMEARGVEPHRIDALLVTHEHADHIRGLGPLARKYDLPVYANAGTWKAMENTIGEIDDRRRHVFETGKPIDFGSLRVESFAISHDAAEPVGFSFSDRSLKLSLATDLGYVSPNVREHVTDSDVLVLESNHDIEMLRIGRYPWNIKRRILGDTGHLSNHAAGEALCELLTERTKRVYLAHLSRDHNLMDLARLTVNTMLEERGLLAQFPRLRLMDTYYDRPTDWDAVAED